MRVSSIEYQASRQRYESKMRWSETLIPTLKETPAEAEAISHKLMIRAGLMRRLSSGAYSYLPLGLKTLKKVELIVREEMEKAGGREVLLPAIQPAQLWRESGRFEVLGEDLFAFKDRHGKEIVLGPTHEEVITLLIKGEVKSYRQLPLLVYQIQTKYRDEPRPRFGVIRSREFIMKDAYSFDRNPEGLEASFAKMHEAYCRIFERCGLSWVEVGADPGIMGGGESHEFMVVAENGEDLIVRCDECGYVASLEMAECTSRKPKAAREKSALQEGLWHAVKEVDTPSVTTVEEVSTLLGVSPSQIVKTLIYEADGKTVAVLIRGDHQANETKLRRLINCSQLTLAPQALIERLTKAPMGFTGPVGLKGVDIIADWHVASLCDFVTGANKKDKHLVNVNVPRDFHITLCGDIKYIEEKDPCPRCNGQIHIFQAIEVGHIFKLGTKYSVSLGATYLDESGQEQPFVMGCYGLGINRIVASVIEQSHDSEGIIWPLSISPYHVLVLPLNVEHTLSKEVSEEMYRELLNEGYDVLLDDRNERAGAKFKDADLIGIPITIVIGEKKISDGKVEIKIRKTGEVFTIGRKKALSQFANVYERLRDYR